MIRFLLKTKLRNSVVKKAHKKAGIPGAIVGAAVPGVARRFARPLFLAGVGATLLAKGVWQTRVRDSASDEQCN